MRVAYAFVPGAYSNISFPVSITLGGVPATLTNPTFQATNLVDNYTQTSIQNKSATANASADHIAYPDNVTASDLTGFMDMGITSSVYAQAAYAITGPNESYLFGSAPSGAGKTGNMVIATDSTGTSNSIQFGTNGFTSKANIRMEIFGSGRVRIGGGADNALGVLQTNGSISITGSVNVFNGNIIANTLGTGLQVKSGANCRIGTDVLVAGTKAVANTSITANSKVMMSVSALGGTQGILSYTKNIGVGFTINSSNAADTSTVDWFIVEAM